MDTCIIFCAGEFHGLIAPISKNALIIAADGGLVHLKKLGIPPHRIIGDFDSLGYAPEGAQVFPVEKDDTDSMLAIRHGLEAGCKTFLIYGATDGPRADHTVANYQALQFLADRGAKGYLIGKEQLVTVLKNDTLSFPSLSDGVLSAFCMGADATGVNLQGLQYPLTDGVLCAGFPLGVSNHFIGKPATVSVKNGSLLLFYPRKAGIPGYADL